MRVGSVEHGPLMAARVQHGWVDITNRWEQPWPGILMAWRPRYGKRAGWECQVVWTMEGPDTRVGWLDAPLVRGTDRLPLVTPSHLDRGAESSPD